MPLLKHRAAKGPVYELSRRKAPSHAGWQDLQQSLTPQSAAHPSEQISVRKGEPSYARALATIFRRSPIDQISGGSQTLLHLQRIYGNRFVGRVLDAARDGDTGHEGSRIALYSTQRPWRLQAKGMDAEVLPKIEQVIDRPRGGEQVMTEKNSTNMRLAVQEGELRKKATQGATVQFQGESSEATGSAESADQSAGASNTGATTDPDPPNVSIELPSPMTIRVNGVMYTSPTFLIEGPNGSILDIAPYTGRGIVDFPLAALESLGIPILSYYQFHFGRARQYLGRHFQSAYGLSGGTSFIRNALHYGYITADDVTLFGAPSSYNFEHYAGIPHLNIVANPMDIGTMINVSYFNYPLTEGHNNPAVMFSITAPFDRNPFEAFINLGGAISHAISGDLYDLPNVTHNYPRFQREPNAAVGSPTTTTQISPKADPAKRSRRSGILSTDNAPEKLATGQMMLRNTVQRYEGPEHQDLGDRHLEDLYQFLRTSEGRQWSASYGLDPADLVMQLDQDPMRRGRKIQVRPGLELTPGEIISLMGDFYGTWQQLANANASEIGRGGEGQSPGLLDVMEQERYGRISHGEAALQYEDITDGRYIRLAQRNETHFARLNRAEWQRLHAEAIEKAREAAGSNDEQTFQQALLIDAAAGHFLTDAFAAGHLFDKEQVTNAISLYLADHPVQAENPEMQAYQFIVQQSGNMANLLLKNIHDRMNTEGIEVANQQGMQWRTYGDDHLRNAEETRHIAALAVFKSRQQIYRTRRGESPDPEEVLALLPTEDSVNNATERAIAYIPEAARQITPLMYRNRMVARSQFGPIFGRLVESNLETIASPGRQRQLEEIISSSERLGIENPIVPSLTIASWK